MGRTQNLSLAQQMEVVERVEGVISSCLATHYSYSGVVSSELKFLFGYWVHFFCQSAMGIWFDETGASAPAGADSTPLNFDNVPADTESFMGLNRSDDYAKYLRDSIHIPLPDRRLVVNKQLNAINPSCLEHGQILLYKPGFKSSEKLMLNLLSAGRIRAGIKFMSMPMTNVDQSGRHRLKEKIRGALASWDFSDWLSSRIAEFFPIIFVEQFYTLVKLYGQNKSSISAIFSSDCWSSDDRIKFVAVFLKGRHGARPKRVGAPHSINYSCLKYFWLRQYEITNLDNYLTWGWVTTGAEPFFTHKFSAREKRVRPLRLPEGFEIVITGASRPGHLIEYPYTPELFTDYLDNQIDLAAELKIITDRSVTIRTRQRDRGSPLENRLRSRGIKDVRFEYQKEKFSGRIQGCLHISDNPSTAIIETFLINQPTLIVIENNFFQLWENSLKEFEELAEAEVFHKSRASLQKFLSREIGSINDWWGSRSTQSAVTNFLEVHARPGAGIALWKRKLMGYINA